MNRLNSHFLRPSRTRSRGVSGVGQSSGREIRSKP